ncbi:MAG: BREX system P-loop protein BrxC [Akkermansiaceae bacterium]
MTLNEIFLKDVGRPIDGVIKADSSTSLQNEVEEYVLTQGVEKNLETFLSAYNNYETANGVWISGFFGSGKSHLLKMLAFVLENHQLENGNTADIFLTKLSDNEFLRADLEKAVKLPSKSILFNIDQKADTSQKNQADALLSVFMKVFNEMCGYYGRQPYIAQFERDLDSRDLFQPFREAFEKHAGKSWETGREQVIFEGESVAAAYSEVTGQSAEHGKGILDKYRDDQTLTIEDFAKHVYDYIQQQPAGFRLNFFVDEVGQYIADNVKLMTNLQTVAESLNTKCRGQAWIIVTAQQDMQAVVGELKGGGPNDFTKIMARFSIRMSLTSQNVEEVIQKRLLSKAESAEPRLTSLYEQQENNFKTLFDFADGSANYKNFQDQEHFINCYPFIPYQFDLFQAAIENLSVHNAFTGKHASVGERSMLDVFQRVAIEIRKDDIGRLATFDRMFHGIRATLLGPIQSPILRAEKHLDHNSTAISLLKALFLIKFVKEFKPTIRNLSILMLDSFTTDPIKHQKKVEEALNILENQTYIQRNGPHYEYLTNEEKNVEEAIKSTSVDHQDNIKLLDDIIFDKILNSRKIRFEDNKQDFSFGKKIDDNACSQQQELTIHVISPFSEHAGDYTTIQSHSTGRDELVIALPADDRLAKDLALYLKTEKYIRINSSNSIQESVRRILIERQEQNKNRFQNLRTALAEYITNAKIFVAGTAIDAPSQDAKSCIILAFNQLIDRTYTNLKLLRGHGYAETDIASILSTDMLSGDSGEVYEPEREILNFLQLQKTQSLRTTIKSIVDHFERKPYGWSYPAILCQLAHLVRKNKIELTQDAHMIDVSEVESTLRNGQRHTQVHVQTLSTYTNKQIRDLKDFHNEFFNKTPSTDAKQLALDTIDGFSTRHQDLELLLAQERSYPFLAQLREFSTEIGDIKNKTYTWCYEKLPKLSEDLLADKEELYDPISAFMTGSQRENYDAAVKLLANNESNFTHPANAQLASELKTLTAAKDIYIGRQSTQLKSLTDQLENLLNQQLEQERKKALDILHDKENKLVELENFTKFTESEQQNIRQIIRSVEASIKTQHLQGLIRDSIRSFEDSTYQQILQKIIAGPPTKSQIDYKEALAKDDEKKGTDKSQINDARNTTIALRDLKPSYSSPILSNEQDIDTYLEALKNAMLSEINDKRKIML